MQRCNWSDGYALRGAFGTCMHSSLSVEAVCRDLKPPVQVGCPLAPAWQELIEHQTHEAPYWPCSCGYYALKHPDPRAYNGNIGAYCQLIGRTIEAERGYRTTRVRILGLFVPIGYPEAEMEQVCEIAERLGVPIALPADALALLRYLLVDGVNPEEIARYVPSDFPED